MVADAKVADVIAKITRDFCIVHEHGLCLSDQRPSSKAGVYERPLERFVGRLVITTLHLLRYVAVRVSAQLW